MINLILFCFGTASLTLFLDMTFQKGQIFRKYYNLITYHFYLDKKIVRKNYTVPYRPRTMSLDFTCGLISTITLKGPEVKWYYTSQFKKNKYIWLWKILGGCSYCFGTWLFICTYLIYSIKLGSLASGQFCYFALCLFLGIGINHVFIKGLEKI